MLFASLESAAATAESVPLWYWLIPIGAVVAGLVFFNWAKVKAAFSSAIANAPKPPAAPESPAPPKSDPIAAGLQKLLELDALYVGLAREEADKLILEGTARLLKARSEAVK